MLRLILPTKALLAVFAGIASLLSVVVIFEVCVLNKTQGVFMVPAKETFVSYTIAKNLAYSQVWALSKYGLYPVSNSLLYPFLLAVPLFIFGQKVIVALAAGILAAVVLLLSIQKWLIRMGFKNVEILFVQLIVVLFFPLPILVIQGTEEVFQLLFFSLLLMQLQTEWKSPKLSVHIYWYGILLVATNFQSIIIILIISLILMSLKRVLVASKLLIFSCLPIAAAIIFSALRGQQVALSVVQLIVHQFTFGWIIGGLTIIAVAMILKHNLFRSIWGIGFLIIGISSLSFNIYSLRLNARSCRWLYEDEWQVGRFVMRYYKKSNIVTENGGVVSWLTEGKKIDLSLLPAKYRGNRTAAYLRPESMAIGIVPPSSSIFLPQEWYKAADWQVFDSITRNVSHTLFYSEDSFSAVRLKQALQDYRPMLPKFVDIQYFDKNVD